MSLLDRLAEQSTEFGKWLSSHRCEPRVCWYPSAGGDFRDLLYLDTSFAEREPALTSDRDADVAPPDLFLHSDLREANSLDTEVLYEDASTTLTVKAVEELQPWDLRDGRDRVNLVFRMVHVRSDELGEFVRPVVSAVVENAALCAEVLLPQEANLSHVVCVRHGGGCGGGGKATGFWLTRLLRPLGAEVFVTDLRLERPRKDPWPFTAFPALERACAPRRSTVLTEFRRMPAIRWSNHGEVIRWLRVR